MNKKIYCTGEEVIINKFTEPFIVCVSSETEGWDTWRPDDVGKFKAKIDENAQLILVDLNSEEQNEISFEDYYENNKSKIKNHIKMAFISSIGAHCLKQTTNT